MPKVGIEVVSEILEAGPATEAIAAVGVETGLVLGGAVLATIAGGVAWAVQSSSAIPRAMSAEATSEPAAVAAPSPPPRENAVLVLGASGRVGRKVVQRLINAGRTVIACARTAEAAQKVLVEEVGLKEGFQQPESRAGGILFFEGVDVREPESLKRQSLWSGVSQVIVVVAGKAGMLPSGQFGYFDGLTPEDVEAKGVVNLMEVLPTVLPKATVQYNSVVPMGNAEEVMIWDRMDDVIMGGKSSSVIEAAPDVGATVARWKGDLIIEGGGFCGARTKKLDNCDLSAYDGVTLRVKGDGSIFKMNIKTTDQLDSPESTYQTTFDTVDGQWHEVTLPWHNFVPVKRAQSDPDGPALDPSKIAKFGLVLSRFEYNKMPNPVYKPGPFELLIDGGIKAYKAIRPQVVHLASAGAERNAIIGDDVERRKADVPIVQLNPGGVLNYKYAAELAVRQTGLPYVVMRSTGMIDSNEGGPFKFEADQGDKISGSLSRDDVADILVQAANSPEAVYKTFEVRRSEALDGRGKAMTEEDYTRMFLKLAMDRHRWRVGLRPFPKYAPPPPPVTEERKQEIVQNIEVVRSKFKAQADANAPAQPEAKEPVKEKELASAGARS